METFKQRFYSLESEVKALTKTLHKTRELESEVHYLSPGMEQGVIPLDDFDTFRFIHTKNWLFTEFIQIDGTWRQSMSCKSNVFFLVNPTNEIKEYVELIAGHKINFSKNTICFKYQGDKASFEEAFTNKEITEFYLFWYQGGPCYGKYSLIRDLRDEVNNKVFEIEVLNHDRITNHTQYDLLLYKFMDDMKFSATLTVDFKEKFLLLPHVSFFITPLDQKFIKASIKELTELKVTFEILYGRETIPTSTQFHWLANGTVPREPMEHTENAEHIEYTEDTENTENIEYTEDTEDTD